MDVDNHLADTSDPDERSGRVFTDFDFEDGTQDDDGMRGDAGDEFDRLMAEAYGVRRYPVAQLKHSKILESIDVERYKTKHGTRYDATCKGPNSKKKLIHLIRPHLENLCKQNQITKKIKDIVENQTI